MGRTAHPDVLALIDPIDDYFDAVRGHDDYVAQNWDQPLDLQTTRGLGQRRWTQDSISVTTELGASLAIDRRWIQSKGIGRLLVSDQAHYTVAYHTEPHTNPNDDGHLILDINPAKSMQSQYYKGAYDARKIEHHSYPIGSNGFHIKTITVLGLLRVAIRPRQGFTGPPFKPQL